MEKFLVLDYESDHEWGLDIWHPEFKLISGDFLFIKGEERAAKFTQDLKEMSKYINFAVKNDYTILVYNASYEFSVTKKVFDIDISNNMVDVMRLHYIVTKKGKLGLSDAVKEYFDVDDYKDKFHEYLIKEGIAKNKKEAKAKVGSLPTELLEEYNKLDTEYTLKVYQHCVAELNKLEFDWLNDTVLYNRDVRRNCLSWLRGVRFDRVLAEKNLKKLIKERDNLIKEFYVEYTLEIQQAEELIIQSYINKDYQDRIHKAVNKDSIKKKEVNDKIVDKCKFNLRSTTHLSVLFVDVFKKSPKIFTEKGDPSFSKNYLSQWGEPGDKLKKIANYKKPINELESMLEHSAVDGNLHFFIRTGGTITGRGSSSMGGV